MINDIWYLIPEKVAFADVSLILEPNNEFIQHEDLDNWESTDTGLFRMYKKYTADPTRPSDESQKIILSNEFKIKK